MNFKKMLAVSLVILLTLAIFSCNKKEAEYPSKAVTIVCPWSPGGGTDTTARYIAQLLAKELGQPVNVINKTGGDGAVGHTSGANAKPDGYTITNVTFELGSLKYLGYSELSPANYIPVAQFNDNAAAVIVSADSKYNTVPELLEDIKSSASGTFTFSGASLGSVWDLARIGMLNVYGIDPKNVKFIPTKGAAPSIVELLGGHVDVITCSYPEAKSQIDAGQLKCIGLMAEKRNPEFNNVPTLKEQGLDWIYTTWRGFALPLETPADVVKTLTSAMDAVFNTADFKDFMKKNGFGIRVRLGDDFGDFMMDQHKDLADIFKISGYGK